jgi:hypothetical protein
VTTPDAGGRAVAPEPPRTGVTGIVPIYPALLVAATVLAVFVDSAAAQPALWRPLLVAIAIVVGLQLALWAVARDRHIAGYFAGLVALLLIAPNAALLLGLAATAPMVLGVVRSRRLGRIPWAALTRPLNIIGTLILGIGIVYAAQSGALAVPTAPEASGASTGTGAPDVYLLLLDGYPRADTLATDFGFDNGPWLAEMAELGFVAAEQSHSNYPLTVLTLASMLNARHIDELIPDPGTSPAGQYRALSRLINSGTMLTEARRLGYSITSIPSAFSVVSLYAADRVLDSGTLTEFDLVMLQQGLIPRILPTIHSDLVLDSHRQSIGRTFDLLAETAQERGDGPQLVLAHVMSPHPPVVFAADGSPIDGLGCYPRCTLWDGGQFGDSDAMRRQIPGQVAHVNDRVLETVRSILQDSEEPPVIVIFSDHGHRHDLDDKAEAVSNLMLAYTPTGEALFDDDGSPINVLPRVLNRFAGTEIRMASEDESYWLPWWTTRDRGIFPLERLP